MTTIDTTSYFRQHNAGSDRPASDDGAFFEALMPKADEPASAPSGRVAELTAELDALKTQQVNMSPTDYLKASFSLKEQITTERLNAGEQLDTIGVRIDGQTYTIAMKRIDISDLEVARLPDWEMRKPVSPRDFQSPGDFQGTAALRNYLARQDLASDE